MLSVCGSAATFSKDFHLPGHFTASAFLLSAELDHILLLHHSKIGDWVQPGGHVEPSDPTLRHAALRELEEETSLSGVEDLGLVDLDIHRVPPTEKAPAHLHFDVRFFFQYRGSKSPAEADVRWFPLVGLEKSTGDASVLLAMQRLYSRLDPRVV
jgi:8-oxo-dGTP pyrophosphatase MutT (NUDIX family)